MVDEAAAAAEAETLIAVVAAKPRSLLLVGDHRQLSATVTSREAEGAGLGRSMFHRLVVASDTNGEQNKSSGGTSPVSFSLLKTQYRMHPAISRFPNTRYYAGQLLDAHASALRSDAHRAPWHSWLPPLAFVDVGGSGVGEERAKSGSYYNQGEAAVAVCILRRLLKGTAQQGAEEEEEEGEEGGRNGLSFCVITMYSAQARVIRQRLRREGIVGTRVPVATVDSFQGSEADCVVLSLVRSNASTNVGFLDDYRRLNVALTRGKRSLVRFALCSMQQRK